MKEITFLVPDESSELITELVEKLGGTIDLGMAKKKRESERKITEAKLKTIKPTKKTKDEKIDHTYLFGKWKDFDIDAKKLREQSW